MAEIGRVVGGRYRLVELVGEGGFAAVYRATDTQLNRDVALKLLRPEYAGDPDFMSDFRWQSRLAASVENENVAAVLDFGTDATGTYLVTEFVDGADLATLLQRNGPVPPRRAARAAAEVARALQAAHDRGLPHGDLRPGNVMVTRDGHVKVTDFGIARAAAAVADVTSANIKRQPVDGGAAGAAGPAAMPGRGLGGAPSEASDVEALGEILYEMLTGRAPWPGDSTQARLAARRAGLPPRPSSLNPAVPLPLDEITLRALAPVPEWRFVSAAALAEALDSFDAAAGGVEAVPAGAAPFVAAGTGTAPSSTRVAAGPGSAATPSAAAAAAAAACRSRRRALRSCLLRARLLRLRAGRAGRTRVR